MTYMGMPQKPRYKCYIGESGFIFHSNMHLSHSLYELNTGFVLAVQQLSTSSHILLVKDG